MRRGAIRTMSVLVVPVLILLGPRGPVGAQEIEWTRQFGGQIPSAEFASAVDADGNVYVAGHTGGALPGQTNAGSVDAFLRKYDGDGNEIWTRQFGTASFDQAHGVAADGGEIYVVGFTLGTLPGETSAGGGDAFIRKYDETGGEVWTRQFGSSGTDQARGVAADATGVYLVGVVSFGALPGETSIGQDDAFIRKYDGNGNDLWTEQFGTAVSDQALGVAADGTAAYLVGFTNGTLPDQGSAGSRDAFIRKYDPSGGPVWTHQFGSSGADEASGVCVEGTGIYCTGSAGGALPGQSHSGLTDVFLRRYDASGDDIWTRQFGTSSVDRAFGVAGETSGIYVAGTTAGLLGGSHTGLQDAFVRKYDDAGATLWTSQFGTPTVDEAWGISADATGVYTTGYTLGTFDGEESSGFQDVFVQKHSDSGDPLWTRQFGAGAPTTDVAAAIDGDGNIYVAGMTWGTLPGETSAGSADAFVRKYDADGNDLWTYQFGSWTLDEALGIAVDAGGVYVAGRTFGALPGETSSGSVDAFVQEMDGAGNAGWTLQFGTYTWDEGLGIAADETGLYVAGMTYGVFPGEAAAGLNDAFVQKVDFAGGLGWVHQFGTASGDRATAVSTDSSGIYAVGSVAGDAFLRQYFDNGDLGWYREFGSAGLDEVRAVSVGITGIYIAGAAGDALPGETHAGGGDAFLGQYDLDGNEGWTRQFGSASLDEALGIAVDVSAVFVAGRTFGTLPGQVSEGQVDAFVQRYDTDGNEQWTFQFGTSSWDQASAIYADGTGLYAAGMTSGTFPGQEGAGGQDAFVTKIVEDEVLAVVIDIKPDGEPNSINLSSAGVIPVAILGSETFDATQVDPTTILLAGAQVKVVGKSERYLAHEEDVNGDGWMDLVCQVVTDELAIETGETTAVLEALTYDGGEIRGEDSIRIVPD